jgi:photosystem II stability/assembly factor-like uncharacterized protein
MITTMPRTLLSAFAFAIAMSAGYAGAQVTLVHVHGLAYSSDGARLIIPSHFGLAIYENGKWSKAPGPEHDYMGFSATASHLYSSGHPAAGSGLVNPFGLLRSKDAGKTWTKLGLEGESDFHVMATSWNTDAVFVWNAAPNSRMRQAGLHFSRDDGATWQRVSARGLVGVPYGIAVHPDDPKTVAAATPEGVFRSSDAGETFLRVAQAQGTTVFFDLDGKRLWYGTFEGDARLQRAQAGGKPERVALPPLTQDAVAFVAQNPARRNEYAIATFNRDVYLSKDAGRTWAPIARRGETR